MDFNVLYYMIYNMRLNVNIRYYLSLKYFNLRITFFSERDLNNTQIIIII